MVRRTHILTALTGLALLLAAPAGAATILIDFETFDGTPALGWNTLDASDSGSVIDLLDDSGIDSGINLNMPTVFNNAGAFDAWNDANTLPTWAPDSAADDYVYFFGNGGGNTIFLFTGLDSSLTYNLDLIVSRDLSRSQDHRVTGPVTVNNFNSQSDGYNNGNVVSFVGLSPNGAGNLRLRIHRDGTSAALNAIRLVSVPGPPGSLLIASSAALLAVAVRRRS